MTRTSRRPQSTDAYIAGSAGPARELLKQVRALVRDRADSARHSKWGHPAWAHPSGTILSTTSDHAKHAHFAFTPSTREAFDADLSDAATGKRTVKLPYGGPALTGLLRMIAYHVREHEDDGGHCSG